MPATRTIVNIEAKNVVWRVAISPTSRRHIAICDALSLTLEAKNREELHSLIPEAIHLLMIDLFAEDELDQFLRDRGWRAPKLPPRTQRNIEFKVPWELVAERVRRDSERRSN